MILPLMVNHKSGMEDRTACIVLSWSVMELNGNLIDSSTICGKHVCSTISVTETEVRSTGLARAQIKSYIVYLKGNVNECR